jgi:hypothetical protein
MNKTRTRDLMIAVAIGVIALLAAIYFYAFESLAVWVQRHDEWQVDALLLLPIILVTVLALYYWRKHGQLEGEVAERRRMEETLRQQRELYEGMLTAQSELGAGGTYAPHVAAAACAGPLPPRSGLSLPAPRCAGRSSRRARQEQREHDVGDSRAAHLLSQGAPASLQRREPGLERG